MLSAILDSRLGFEISQGTAVIAGFVAEDELEFWEKMRFPARETLIQQIEEMESEKFGLNVDFAETTADRSRS